jgi:predicted enzyme related to lactoylglutathione lyase
MFTPGTNIAMKVPAHQYEATVAFYRDVLKLALVAEVLVAEKAPAIGFQFGSMTLWIDRMPALSQSEVWFEIVTKDVEAARAALTSQGAVICSEVEPLPEGFAGFWILNPAQIVHLVAQEE